MKKLGSSRMGYRLIKIWNINKPRNRHKTKWNHGPRRWIIIEFTISESWCYSNFFSLLLPSFSPSLLHAESFTLYSFLLDHLDRTLVSHLTVTWVHVPASIFFGFLWTVVVEITLFKGLLHINAVRKVAVVH